MEYGLVLAGGGVRGAYQIGVWKALKELKIKVSAVSGVSIGAVNGALFVQGSKTKAERLWNKIAIDDIILLPKEMENDENLFKVKNLMKIAKEIYSNNGLDMSPLENLLNEAAINAAKEDRAYIMQEDIKKSFVKVGIGAEKKSRIISEKEKRITAFHEAGHAILFHVLPDVGPVYSISIIPTGAGAAGYTMPLPEHDEMFDTKGRMLQQIVVDLGGRVAEELIFDDITTGASQDIKQATQLAKAMVTKYGMSDNVGLINYDNEDDEVFIGRDLAHARGYGEGVAARIDDEVKRIIDECYARAKAIIREHEDVLNRCAELLLEKEKISREEFEALFS